MIIGITGGTGCGKTTFLRAVEALGGLVLDCDVIYHQLLKTDISLLQAIENRFPGCVSKSGLDRKKLASIVFADDAALQDLNRITHGAVKQEVLRRLASAPKLAAIDAIGLFESSLSELCQLTVAITAPLEQRIQRLTRRDGISEEAALQRIQAQKEPFYYAEKCDFVLENNESEEVFLQTCLAFLKARVY